MESVLGRYRNLIALTAVLFAQVLGLAVQVKRTTDTESTRLIRIWAVTAVSPFEKALVWTQTSTRNVWRNYFYLRGVRAENRDLKRQIEQMRLEQVRLAQDADQARRLQALLAFKEQVISETLPAQVIGLSGSEQSRSVYLDKGEKDGVKPDMAVIDADGIIGKVLRVYSSTSLVLLLNDQTSGVGAILERSRLQGILRGTPAGEVVLEKVMSDETVAPGERVLTSGGDRIFPKGMFIGTVTKVSPGPELFLNIRVTPAANLSKLEEVLVITKIDEKQATPDLIGPVRAVDILAERLPTVPPKPETPPAGTAPQLTAKPNTGTSPAGSGSATQASTTNPSTAGAANPKTPVTKPAVPGTHDVTTKPPAVAANAGSVLPNLSVKPKTSPISSGANRAVKTAPGAGTSTHAANPAVSPSAADNISQGAAKPDVPTKPATPPEDNPQ